MITGFNTDIKHKTKVYHVQTEDKGRENPKIETLVYLGGEILDSTKVAYRNDPPLSEESISERMETQHKRVIRNIKIGKYDDPGEDNWELGDHSLDEAVLSYLAENHSQGKLEIELSGMEHLVPDAKSVLIFRVYNSSTRTPVPRAHVKVKLLCPNSTAKTLTKGETNEQGTLELPITLPADIFSNHCSLRIQVLSDSGTAEKQFLLG